MRIERRWIWTALLAWAVPTLGMDGIVISNILGNATYRWEFTPGKLAKYEIRDNYVVRVDSLGIDTAHSPQINRSGTYFAYLTRKMAYAEDWFTRELRIRSIDNTGPIKTIPITRGANWLWWLPDGSIMYTVNVIGKDAQNRDAFTGQKQVRRLTFSKVGGQLQTTDVLAARIEPPIQGGWVGIDGTGRKIGFMSSGVNGVTGGFLLGDTNRILNSTVSKDCPGLGCGWSLSPSGEYATQYIGGHSVISWFRWDQQAMAPNYAQFSVLNSTWAAYRDSDPESKLEISLDGGKTWTKNPIGVMGQDNMFAVNSDFWHLCEIGAAWAETDAYTINMIAISWKWQKAINVTKIMPFSAQPSSRNQFRGVTFAGKDRCADRGTLWCSSQQDVHPPLWQYVQNRQADGQFWADLLGLPAPTVDIIGTTVSHGAETRGLSMARTTGGYRAKLSGNGAFVAGIFSASGKLVDQIEGCGRVVNLPVTRPGTHVVKVEQEGKTFVATVAGP